MVMPHSNSETLPDAQHPTDSNNGLPEPADETDSAVAAVEVILKTTEPYAADLKDFVEAYMRDNYQSIRRGIEIEGFSEVGIELQNVKSISVVDISDSAREVVQLAHCRLEIFIFYLHNEIKPLEDSQGRNDDSQGYSAVCTRLPAVSLQHAWGSLVFPNDIKKDFLRYFDTVTYFEEQGVDPTVVHCQKLILLHGPPGTGKTSLCRALAHKIATRYHNDDSYSLLVEINAASLFSPMFSNSARLVTELFERLSDLSSAVKGLIFVLIDEVDMLVTSRELTVGIDPTESARVVSTLLLELDRLKQRPNVYVMATTNNLDTTDLAFIDRADLVRGIGPPHAAAAYEILRSSLNELMQKGVVDRNILHTYEIARNLARSEAQSDSSLLLKMCKEFQDESDSRQVLMSGRELRRMCVTAHARYVQSRATCTLRTMLLALQRFLRESCN